MKDFTFKQALVACGSLASVIFIFAFISLYLLINLSDDLFLYNLFYLPCGFFLTLINDFHKCF